MVLTQATNGNGFVRLGLMGSIMGSIGIGFDWMRDLGVVHGGFVVE